MRRRPRLVLVAWVVALGLIPAARAAGPATVSSFRIKNLDGETLDFEALRAKGPVLLDFWATWCKPCLAAIPEIETIARHYRGRGLTVIGVCEDGPRNYAKVRPFVKRLGVTFAVVLDTDEALSQKFQIRALPTTILIDRAGHIARFTQGYRPGESDALEGAVNVLIEPASGDDPAPAASDSSGAAR